MSEQGEEKEGRVIVDGSPARVVCGVDQSGNKRMLRCDQDGYLLTIPEAEAENTNLLTEASEWKLTRMAKAGTTSEVVDLGNNYAYLQVVIPTIDSAQLELQVSDSETGTFQDLGQDATTTAGTGAFNDTWVLGGWRYIKIKASAAQSTTARYFKVRGVTY